MSVVSYITTLKDRWVQMMDTTMVPLKQRPDDIFVGECKGSGMISNRKNT
jgi:Flp pilus assembly CpaF family ATPase